MHVEGLGTTLSLLAYLSVMERGSAMYTDGQSQWMGAMLPHIKNPIRVYY